MTRWMLLLAAILIVLISLGCRVASAGFDLPPGDVAAGEAAFKDLGCTSCHRVQGANLPAPHVMPAILLGGPTPVVPTDGELTTGIIHPSARIMARYPASAVLVDGRSRMPDLGDQMTVRQMADLVAFLRAHYEYVPLPAAVK